MRQSIARFDHNAHIPPAFHALHGFSLLHTNDEIEGGLNILRHVSIPLELNISGEPEHFWLALYYYKIFDFEKAYSYVELLKEVDLVEPAESNLIDKLCETYSDGGVGALELLGFERPKQ